MSSAQAAVGSASDRKLSPWTKLKVSLASSSKSFTDTSWRQALLAAVRAQRDFDAKDCNIVEEGKYV